MRADLESNADIRDEIQSMCRLFVGDMQVNAMLREMRIAGLHLMSLLKVYRPRLIGSVLTGHIRRGSVIDLHLFADSLDAVTGVLDYLGYQYETQRKECPKNGETRL